MGGSIGLGNVTPAAEFNIWADPDAAQRVFTSGLDVTMVGLDVTQKALFTAEQNDRLVASAAARAPDRRARRPLPALEPRKRPASRSTTPWRSAQVVRPAS